MRGRLPEFQCILDHAGVEAVQEAFVQYLYEPNLISNWDYSTLKALRGYLAIPLYEKLRTLRFSQCVFDSDSGNSVFLSPLESAMSRACSFFVFRYLLEYWDIHIHDYIEIEAPYTNGWSVCALQRLFSFTYELSSKNSCILCGKRISPERFRDVDWNLIIERIRLERDINEPLPDKPIGVKLRWIYDNVRSMKEQQRKGKDEKPKVVCLRCYYERSRMCSPLADDFAEPSAGLLDIDF